MNRLVAHTGGRVARRHRSNSVLDTAEAQFRPGQLDALAIDEKKRDDVVNNILGFETFELNVPLVAQAVLSKARSPGEVLQIALDVRDSKPAERFREFAFTVDKAIAGGIRREVEQAIRELQSIGLNLAAIMKVSGDEYSPQPQQSIRYGSPLLANVLELAAAPVRGWWTECGLGS